MKQVAATSAFPATQVAVDRSFTDVTRHPLLDSLAALLLQ